MKTLTIYTTTYNRAYTLPKLFESLNRQTSRDFLWLIIDDGSADNTKSLVDKWKMKADFEIQYIYKENGGMHTGHNAAYHHLETELNMCIDSDDYVVDDAVEKIVKFWNEHRSEDCGGIYALDQTPDGKLIGEAFPDDLAEFKGWGCKVIYYKNKKHKVKGDKKFISVTKILKKYDDIPVFENEKYFSLYYKQHLIERDYKIKILNEPICVVEYLPDGSSLNMFIQYFKNPKSFQHLRIMMLKMAPTLEIKFPQAIHYINSCLILKDYKIFKKDLNALLILSAIPFGIVLHIYNHYMVYKLTNG